MLSTMLMDTQFKDSLINAASKEEFLALINQKETEQHAKEDQKQKTSKNF